MFTSCKALAYPLAGFLVVLVGRGLSVPLVPGFSVPLVRGFSVPLVPGFSVPFVPGFSVPLVLGLSVPLVPGFSVPLVPGFSVGFLLVGLFWRSSGSSKCRVYRDEKKRDNFWIWPDYWELKSENFFRSKAEFLSKFLYTSVTAMKTAIRTTIVKSFISYC